jgi:glycosyltransferase 2 family protein
MDRRQLLRVAIGIAVLVVIAWFLARSVDLHLVGDLIATSSWSMLLLTIPVIIASHVVRATRWRRLLAHLPDKVGVFPAFNAVMIGYAANTIVPRLGEVLRPLALSRATTVPFPTALSSVVIERTLDILSLLLGVAAIFLFAPSIVTRALPTVEPTTIIIVLVVPVIILATVLFLLAFTSLGSLFIDRVVSPLTTKGAERSRTVLADLQSGAGALSRGKQWPMIVVETAAIWTLWVVPLWMIAEAMPWQVHIGAVDAAMLLVVKALRRSPWCDSTGRRWMKASHSA